MSRIRFLTSVMCCVALASCGGGGSSGGGSGSTNNPAPAPTPTPTPSITYQKYTELTGNQDFQSGCAGLYNASELIFHQGFGYYPTIPSSLVQNYDAASSTWTVEGQEPFGVEFSYQFGPADLHPSSTDQLQRYERVDGNGFNTRYSIYARDFGGTYAEYVRSSRLFARPLDGGALNDIYCVFGVPTDLDDSYPTSSFDYPAISLGGTAFVRGGAANGQYDLTESVVTLNVNPNTGEVKPTMQLVGRLFTPSGLADERTQLGTYTGTAEVDGTMVGFSSYLESSDRAYGISQFGGWFFGPQGKEVGFVFSLMATQPDGGEITATGAIQGRR